MSEVPTVDLARHGETEWSKSGQHTGRTDIPLTAKGESDGRRLADRLAGTAYSHVLSSPLQRAAKTAALAGFQPEIDADLLEWNYGRYEGLMTADIRRDRPDWDLFRDGCPDGESPAEIADRVDRLIGRLRQRSGRLLLFAHGHILRVLAARWVGQPVTFAGSLLLSTATVSTLGFDHADPDEPAISLWNDGHHLK
ncbi:MAG TPA: histidine phosphatase family protein [Fimbriiglobus sp.]|jgi:probable phosphoglycerate mutase